MSDLSTERLLQIGELQAENKALKAELASAAGEVMIEMMQGRDELLGVLYRLDNFYPNDKLIEDTIEKFKEKTK